VQLFVCSGNVAPYNDSFRAFVVDCKVGLSIFRDKKVDHRTRHQAEIAAIGDGCDLLNIYCFLEGQFPYLPRASPNNRQTHVDRQTMTTVVPYPSLASAGPRTHFGFSMSLTVAQLWSLGDTTTLCHESPDEKTNNLWMVVPLWHSSQRTVVSKYLSVAIELNWIDSLVRHETRSREGCTMLRNDIDSVGSTMRTGDETAKDAYYFWLLCVFFCARQERKKSETILSGRMVDAQLSRRFLCIRRSNFSANTHFFCQMSRDEGWFVFKGTCDACLASAFSFNFSLLQNRLGIDGENAQSATHQSTTSSETHVEENELTKQNSGVVGIILRARMFHCF
jgi:hypothetical protein